VLAVGISNRTFRVSHSDSFWRTCLVFLAFGIFSTAVSGNSITSPDTNGLVGEWSSLELDPAGNPVVSYYDASNGDLKILHCNDPNCVGGDESITSPDTTGRVGEFSSLELDANGYPVVAYYDYTNQDLRVMHCNDPNCEGNDESIVRLDSNNWSYTGWEPSLTLDANGYPVVSYREVVPGNVLKLIHCNDPNCEGNDESITAPDTNGIVGQHSSVTLDANGYPVISYFDSTNIYLKVMHCNDANCSGGDESIEFVDNVLVGYSTTIILDANGNPVISYQDLTLNDMKVVHCNDPDCSGGDESITSPLTQGRVGGNPSMELDSSGNPVVSFWDASNDHLRLMQCNDPDCAGGDESIAYADTTEGTGRYTSLALDAAGNPVVSYWDSINRDLKLLHCSTPDCLADTSNADLSSLVVSVGLLTPPFDSSTTSYSVNVENSVTEITVTPTAADAAATITVNGSTVASGTASAPIALAVGTNTITVDVTAQDNSIKSYVVNVIREAPPNFTVIATVAAGNGTVSCNPPSVAAGGSSTCTAVPDAGWQVSGWTGDCAAAGTSTSCTLDNIQANQSSTVSFELVPVVNFTVSATVATGSGSVSCAPASVAAGGSSTCTAVPDAGWQVSGWTGSCAATGTGSTCTLDNIQADQSSTVSFEAISYNVVATVAIGNGTVSCDPTSVVMGGSTTCTAVPDAGWQVSGWSGDCATAGTSTICTLDNVMAEMTVTVTFELSATEPLEEAKPVPALSRWGLALLGLLLVGIVAFRQRW